MEKPQILLFDLDGTLLRNDKTLSEYTLEILSKCKECGYITGISTSRGEQNCLSFLRELKPDILISSGGALIRVNGKIIISSFSVTETKGFIEYVQTHYRQIYSEILNTIRLRKKIGRAHV